MLTIFLTVLCAMFKRNLFLQLFLLAAISAIEYTSAGTAGGVGSSDADYDANGSAAGQVRDVDSEAGKSLTESRHLVSGKGKGKGKGKVS
jgi:hypothetical protein